MTESMCSDIRRLSDLGLTEVCNGTILGTLLLRWCLALLDEDDGSNSCIDYRGYFRVSLYQWGAERESFRMHWRVVRQI